MKASSDIQIETLLQRYLPDLNIELPENIAESILQYLMLLQKWNKTYNLTSIDDPANMVFRHVLDSLSAVPYLQGDRILDVGTGAGLPGILLALARPDKAFVLLDSNSKKTRFMTQVCLEIKIQNVDIQHSRIEDYQPNPLFSTVISRAYSSLTQFYQQTIELCDGDGQILAMKGRLHQSELDDLFKLTSAKAIEINVPGLRAERHFILMTKTTQH